LKILHFQVEYKALEEDQNKIFSDKQLLINEYLTTNDTLLSKQLLFANIADKENRKSAQEIIKNAAEEQDLKVETNDKDYVFIHFILHNLPKGLIGLLLAVILSAAMSSTASELNALGSTTAIDLYKRNIKVEKSDKHYVNMSKWFTLLWGIIAILVASVANLFDNLIQLVNIIGSIFYGNVLGIFLLAFFIKYVRSNAVFIAALVTQVMVILTFYFAIYRLEKLGEEPLIGYLWLNLIGCVLVIFLAVLFQMFSSNNNKVMT